MHNGLPPTVEELRKELNVGSSRTVMRYLEQLEESGDIVRWPGSRGIRLRRTLEGGIQTTSVPLVGDVTAGMLSLAEEYVEGWLRLPIAFTQPQSAMFFLLRVNGDSMNKARVEGGTIEDGDLVLVRQQQIANPDDIVVALVDGEVTIKRLRKAPGYYILQPESTNRKHQPIIVNEEFQVQGVVCRVIKKGLSIIEQFSET